MNFELKQRADPVETAVVDVCDDNSCIEHGSGTRICLFDGRYIDGIDTERWE